MYNSNLYLEKRLAEGELKKQRYYDHVKSFKNEFYANSNTLSSYVWEMIKRKNVALALTWEENIFQYNKKVFFMPPQETSDHYLSISG